MNKLGISLKDVIFYLLNRFHLIDTIKLGIKLIALIEKLHKAGYVHLDIKPDNILIGDYFDVLP